VKYTKELLKAAVQQSESYAGVLRYLGLKIAGGNQAHIVRKIEAFGIDTTHFTGQAHRKGKSYPSDHQPDSFYLKRFPEGSRRVDAKYLRRGLVNAGVAHKCSICGLDPEWNGQALTLQVDHVDGDWYNNVLDNLRFLCPNCHSQTETWGRKKMPT
jgi:5-methylcytosine-specific restriction endonuclease McrA